jgi:hypothetical protein
MEAALPLDRHPALLRGLKTTQIIVIALLVGVVALGGVFFGLRAAGLMERDEAVAEAVALTPILIAFAGLQVLVVLVVRSAVITSARRKIRDGSVRAAPRRLGTRGDAYLEAGDAGHLFKAWMTRTIVTAACFEGGALMCLVAYLLEGEAIALIAAAVCAFLLATQIPTRGRLDQWLNGELLRLGSRLGS